MAPTRFSRATPTSKTHVQRRGAALRLLAASSVAVLLATSACSESGSNSAEDSSVSPLLEAIHLAGNEYAVFESTLLDSYETALKKCMESAGFEHTKQPALQVNLTVTRQEATEIAGTVGYGISSGEQGLTFVEDDPVQRLPLYNLSEEQSQANQEAYNQAVDANDQYLEALSEQDQERYDQARYGTYEDESGETDTSEDLDVSEPQASGCEAEAADLLVDPAEEVLEDEAWTSLVEKINNFFAESDSQESTLNVFKEWSACMTKETGEEFDSPIAVMETISAEAEALWGGSEDGFDEEWYDEEGFDQEFSEKEFDIDDLIIDDGSGTDNDLVIEQQSLVTAAEPSQDSAVEDLTAREIKLAQADVKCRYDMDYFTKIRASQMELERKFVADNKADFDAFAQAIQKAREAK